MFKIIAREGKYSPRVFCDYCQKRIDDASMALVMYRTSVTDGEVPFVIVHKGECDTAAKIVYHDAGGWTQLDTVFVWTLMNLGVKTPEQATAAYEMAEMMASI